jgi:hypothetical protein
VAAVPGDVSPTPWGKKNEALPGCPMLQMGATGIEEEEEIWKKMFTAHMEQVFRCLERLRKITKIIKQDSRLSYVCLERYSYINQNNDWIM